MTHYNGLDFTEVWSKDQRRAARLVSALPRKASSKVKLNPYWVWDEQDWIAAKQELYMRTQNMKASDAKKQKIDLPHQIVEAEARRAKVKQRNAPKPGSKEHLEESQKRYAERMERMRQDYNLT